MYADVWNGNTCSPALIVSPKAPLFMVIQTSNMKIYFRLPFHNRHRQPVLCFSRSEMATILAFITWIYIAPLQGCYSEAACGYRLGSTVEN